MAAVSLDEFMALNDQLAALARAGVPVDVGLATASGEATDALERINAAVARRVRLGATLAAALESEEGLPAGYRCLVQTWLQGGDLAAALNAQAATVRAVDRSWSAARLGMFYPLIVACFAFLGLVGMCLFFLPKLTGIYLSLQLEPGGATWFLERLRATLPYWVGIPPAALLILAVWRMRARWSRKVSGVPSDQELAWLPGMSQVVFQERCANFCETLAALLEGNAALEAALQTAGDGAGEASLRAGATELAASLKQGQMLPQDNPAALRFPPFLRWALWQSDATVGRVRALRMAASLYRRGARRRAERVSYTTPLVACLALGGGVTLLYGLALFVPIVELLTQLAS